MVTRFTLRSFINDVTFEYEVKDFVTKVHKTQHTVYGLEGFKAKFQKC